MIENGSKYHELYRGVLLRHPTVSETTANSTPSLGIGFYIDPGYELPPVLELSRLSIDMGTQLGQNKKELRDLVLWDPRERDEFFDIALKGGLFHRFGEAKRSHEVRSYTMLSLVMQSTAENFSKSLAGEAKSEHKDFSADFLHETLMRGANDAYATFEEMAKSLSSGGNPFSGPKGAELALRSVIRAIDAIRIHDNPGQLFQAITQETFHLTRQVITSGRDAGGFVAAWFDSNSKARHLDRYLRQGLPDTELLTVEPSAELYSGDHNRRSPNDFTGDFPLSIHWDDRARLGGEERRLNRTAACQTYGFNISPAGFRKSAIMKDRLMHGMPWAQGGLMIDSPMTQASGMDRIKPEECLVPGTPVDLPVELAERRLELLHNAGRADHEPETLAELTEILDAHEEGRAVNYRIFRAASMELPPATQMIEGFTLDHLQRQLEELEKACRDLASNPDQTPEIAFKRNQANLLADEMQFWIEHHQDSVNEEPQSGATLRSPG